MTRPSGVKPASVALVRGERGRRANVEAVLANLALAHDRPGLDSAACVLIKPNFVSVTKQAASTHVDAVRAILDFVRARHDGRVVVAEGAATAPTHEGFRNFGYQALIDEYNVELVDLNADPTLPVRVYDRRLQPLTLHLARTVVEADYRISVGPPKTHDVVIVTLSLKNVVMGSLVNPQAVERGGGGLGLARRLAQLLPQAVRQSPLAEWAKGTLLGTTSRSSKMAMHQGVPVINLNLALVAPLVWPHLAVIDGWQGMEGAGPSHGDLVDWRVALAGLDPLAVDVLTTHLMGFDPGRVGYLQYCRRLGLGVGDLDQIEVLGQVEPNQVQQSFQPHPTYRRQLAWELDGVDRLLQIEDRGRR